MPELPESTELTVPKLIRETSQSKRQRAGWLLYEVPGSWVERAQQWRADRDAQFRDRDVYEREDSDERWVGELGEMVFDWWLGQQGVQGHQWIKNKPAGRPDFHIQSARIGVKTVKRRGQFYTGYCGQVSERHLHEPSDAFFFLSYQWCAKNRETKQWDECRRIWLIGGCSRAKFERHAHRTEGPATDPCNPEYKVRAGHTIYNAYEEHFVPPREWLGLVLKRYPRGK